VGTTDQKSGSGTWDRKNAPRGSKSGCGRCFDVVVVVVVVVRAGTGSGGPGLDGAGLLDCYAIASTAGCSAMIGRRCSAMIGRYSATIGRCSAMIGQRCSATMIGCSGIDRWRNGSRS